MFSEHGGGDGVDHNKFSLETEVDGKSDYLPIYGDNGPEDGIELKSNLFDDPGFRLPADIGRPDQYNMALYLALKNKWITREGDLTPAGEKHYHEEEKAKDARRAANKPALDKLAEILNGPNHKNNGNGKKEKIDANDPKKRIEERLNPYKNKFGKLFWRIVASNTLGNGNYEFQLLGPNKKTIVQRYSGSVDEIIQKIDSYLDDYLEKKSSEKFPTDSKGRRMKREEEE